MNLISSEQIENSIRSIRGHRVLLDSDLAKIYGVSTKRLNEQVKRNLSRFPEDFMFQLSENEGTFLRSQFATSNDGRGGRRYKAYVFTEHGALMLANVLNSPIAVAASIQVVRAFIHLRQMLTSHSQLSLKLDELERKYDNQFQSVFNAIRQLMVQPTKSQRKIGIRSD